MQPFFPFPLPKVTYPLDRRSQDLAIAMSVADLARASKFQAKPQEGRIRRLSGHTNLAGTETG